MKNNGFNCLDIPISDLNECGTMTTIKEEIIKGTIISIQKGSITIEQKSKNKYLNGTKREITFEDGSEILKLLKVGDEIEV